MKRYFFISLLIHLLVLGFYLYVRPAANLDGFYFGQSAAETEFLAVSLLDENEFGATETDGADYELIGVEELAVYASPQNRPPEYPALALRRRWQGETILLLSVNKNGALDKVELVRSSGHKTLDEAALRAAQDWRFKSPRRGLQVNFPVRFVLQN
jgi:protein TonB